MAGRDFNVAIAVRHTDNLKNLMTDVKSYRAIANKMLQYPPESCHLDTFILIASSLKIGGNVAQTASFVQEIHAFDRRNWLRIRPKVRFWGCGISGLGPE